MDRRTFLACCAAVPAAASIWFPRIGKVYYVSDTAELLAALAKVLPGDHIYLATGWYASPLVRDLPAQQMRIVDTNWS